MKKHGHQTLSLDRSLIKTYTASAGSTDLSHYNIISGNQLPEQIIICMIDQTAYQGEISKNPFNFQNFDCSEASNGVNGVHEPEQ